MYEYMTWDRYWILKRDIFECDYWYSHFGVVQGSVRQSFFSVPAELLKFDSIYIPVKIQQRIQSQIEVAFWKVFFPLSTSSSMFVVWQWKFRETQCKRHGVENGCIQIDCAHFLAPFASHCVWLWNNMKIYSKFCNWNLQEHNAIKIVMVSIIKLKIRV